MAKKRGQRRVRLTDVAAAAGVSQAAVSMALRDSEEIGATTRERIKRVCAEMGYVGPHMRGMGVKPVSRRYGLLVLHVHDNMYIERLLDGLSQSAVEKDGRVEVHVISNVEDKAKVVERSLNFAANVDGVLVCGWIERYLLEALDAKGIAYVVVGPCLEDPNAIPARLSRAVVFDSSAMGRQATEYLLGRGHKRVGFVVEQMPSHMFNAGWYDGYRLACMNALGEVEKQFVYVGEGTGTADQIAHVVLGQKVRPSAYVLTAPGPAALFLRTLERHGVKVEKADVVVCGDEEMLEKHKVADHPVIFRSLKDLAQAGIARLHQMVVSGKMEFGVWNLPFEKRNFG
jgi:LacI family transcriptional regulator